MATGECLSPLHRPVTYPGMDPGEHEHTCPGCGEKIVYFMDEHPKEA